MKHNQCRLYPLNNLKIGDTIDGTPRTAYELKELGCDYFGEGLLKI